MTGPEGEDRLTRVLATLSWLSRMWLAYELGRVIALEQVIRAHPELVVTDEDKPAGPTCAPSCGCGCGSVMCECHANVTP